MGAKFKTIFLVWILFSNLSESNGAEYDDDNDEDVEDPGIYTCDTEPDRCQFPSGSHLQCVNDREICQTTDCTGQILDIDTDFFCNPKFENHPEIQNKPWSKCAPDCFNGSDRKEFQAGQSCTTEIRKCIFPFVVNGNTYTDCTDDSLSGSGAKEDFKWCATSTNGDRSMKNGKWGICNVSTCGHIKPGPQPERPQGLTGGAIAGIVISVIIVFALVAGGIGYAAKTKKFCFADHQQVPTDHQL